MRCGRLARRRLERALKQIGPGHYEGHGFILLKTSKGDWELGGMCEPIKFSLRIRAFDYVEKLLDKTNPNWRPKSKTYDHALRTYRNTIQ